MTQPPEKRYLRGHGTYTGTHIDSHYRHTNHCSRSVLSKYYSRPSWISDEEDSSDSETSTDISSTIQVVHTNLRNEIISLLAKANEINNDMTNEHQRYFNKSIEDLTFRVNEERKFKWIRQAEEHLLNYI